MVRVVSKYMLPSLRAAATSGLQVCAAYTIQQVLMLLKSLASQAECSEESPEVEIIEVGGAGADGIKAMFEPEVLLYDA